jgi:hypothetical protein
MTVRAPVRRSVNQFDRQLMQHLLAWAPYGRPPREDCLSQFGIPAPRFEERVHEIVAEYLRCALSADDRLLIARVVNVIERSQCA